MKLAIYVELDEDQSHALLRFDETCQDGQEYDVGRVMMKRLASIGMVRWCGGSRFEITDAGISAVESLKEQAA